MVECDPNSPPSQSASTFQHGAKTSRIESNPFSNKAAVTGYSIRGSAWDEEGGVEEEEDDSSDQPQILLATGPLFGTRKKGEKTSGSRPAAKKRRRQKSPRDTGSKSSSKQRVVAAPAATTSVMAVAAEYYSRRAGHAGSGPSVSSLSPVFSEGEITAGAAAAPKASRHSANLSLSPVSSSGGDEEVARREDPLSGRSSASHRRDQRRHHRSPPHPSVSREEVIVEPTATNSQHHRAPRKDLRHKLVTKGAARGATAAHRKMAEAQFFPRYAASALVTKAVPVFFCQRSMFIFLCLENLVSLTQCWGSGSGRIRIFFLDPDPDLFVPDPARMKEHIYLKFISNFSPLSLWTVQCTCSTGTVV